MSTGYALAYRFGLTPWERAGEAGTAQLASLLDRVEHDHAARGRALDLGCGRGQHAVELARRGWQVTGIDLIPRALQAARERAAQAGQPATFVQGDVTELPAEIGRGFRLVIDIGCFHGLPASQQLRMGREVDAVTSAGADLLLLCFAPGGRRPMPRGAGAEDVRQAFRDWTILEQEPAITEGMPGPLRHRAPTFYWLRRS